MKKIEKEKKCPSSEGHLFCKGGRLCFCTFPYRSALCSFHRDWLLTECGHLEIFLKVVYQETNQTITLAVDPDDSIANLKSIINAKKGFPVDEQGIVCNGRELEDDRTVSDYNIPNKSTLNLVLRVNGHNRMEVTILTEARGPEATYTLAVRPTESILEVKLKIRDMTGVPPHKQILNFADRELENTRIISDYNIRNDSVIYLVEKIEVCLVFSSTQERMALELRPKDTVESVKEKIHAKIKISPYRQILQFNGELLDDVHSLNYYNIENKSTLFLYLAVEIFVKMSTGIDVRFKLIKSNTIKNVKERIQLSQDIPCDMQRLHYLRRLLEDKYTLSDYSIKNGSVLDCNVLLISINVKMPNKDDISVDVCPEDKVRIVIDKIQARVAIPSDHQCLMYDGIKLVHGRILRDYQIRNGSILNLVKSGGGRAFDALRQIERETIQWTTKLQSNLETIAHEKGFTISENEGGGNCMFIALSEQLDQAKGIKISHQELRQRVVQYLKENPKMRDGTELFHFVHGYPSWDAYLTSMMADGTWGDHVILHGAANCYEMCVHVISSLGHDSDVIICEEFDVTGSKRLVLGHVAEVHYVSLFPHKGGKDV